MTRKATDAPMATDVDEVNPADGVGEGVLPVVVVVVVVSDPAQAGLSFTLLT